MKLHVLIHSQKAIAATCAVFAATLFSIGARADEWDKKTVLTVKQPIQIRETLLQPGQYVLRLVDSASDRHVVQIFQGDGIHIINTVLAIPIQRTFPTGDTQFTFWETPLGTAKAMRAWFYPGDVTGNEFPYPNKPVQIATVVPPPPATASVSNESATTTTTTTGQSAQTETVPAQPVEPQPEETAQAATPPPTPEPAPAPADNSADRAAPAELPKQPARTP